MKRIFLLIAAFAFIATMDAQTWIQVKHATDQQRNFKIGGSFAEYGDISITIATDQNDWSPTGLSTASIIRLTCGSGDTITGLAGGADGRIITIFNVGSNSATLISESSSSTAANRFKTVAGNVRIPVNGLVTLIYDSTTSRWRVQAQSQKAGIYRGLITQTSTSAPTETAVLENSLPTTVTWARTSAGFYTATLAVATTAKVFVIVGQPTTASSPPVVVDWTWGQSSATVVITIKTYNSGTLTDADLSSTPVEIYMYP